MSYQICTRCVMDTSDPAITFDEAGVCSHCQRFETIIRPRWFPGEEGQRKLAALAEEIKAYGRGKEYDCILGLSGGVDSSYLAYVAVKQLGLRPLAVHVDAGWNSELAVQNIEHIVKKLGIDLHTHVVDWPEMKDLQVAYLRAGVANQDVPQDHAFFAKLYEVAVKKGIKYVLNGSNFATEGILPRSWGYQAMDLRNLMGIHRRFGTRKLKRYPRISFFQYYVEFPYLRGMKVVCPLDYMDYHKADAMRVLETELGWRYYGGKHYESRFTKFFQGYYLPTKFGYDKRRAHLSSLIVSGQLTREEALKELEKPSYPPDELADDLAFVAKKLGLAEQELADLIAAPNRTYADFPSNQRFFALKDRFKTYLGKAPS